jgi:hypothetical protein
VELPLGILPIAVADPEEYSGKHQRKLTARGQPSRGATVSASLTIRAKPPRNTHSQQTLVALPFLAAGFFGSYVVSLICLFFWLFILPEKKLSLSSG